MASTRGASGPTARCSVGCLGNMSLMVRPSSCQGLLRVAPLPIPAPPALLLMSWKAFPLAVLLLRLGQDPPRWGGSAARMHSCTSAYRPASFLPVCSFVARCAPLLSSPLGPRSLTRLLLGTATLTKSAVGSRVLLMESLCVTFLSNFVVFRPSMHVPQWSLPAGLVVE